MSSKDPNSKENVPSIEEHYRLLLENIKDYAIFSLDLEGRVTSWNTGAERILGYTEEEILGQSGFQFFTPEDRRCGEPEKELAKCLAESRADNERWHLRKNGSRFWGSGVVVPFRDQTGNVCGFAKVMRDLTEQRQAFEALRRQAEIINQVHDAIIATDLDGRVTLYNRGAERLFGHSKAEVVGKHFSLLFPNQIDFIHKNILTPLWREGIYQKEGPIRRKSGETIYVHLSASLLRNPEGSPIGMIGIAVDITERKRAQQDLDRFFQLSLDILYIATLDGCFKAVNPALEKTLGYTRAELLASRFLDFVHPDDLAAAIDQLDQLKAGLPIRYFENRYRCKDGSYKWLAWTAFSVPDEGLMYAVAQDVTKQKQAEAERAELLAREQAARKTAEAANRTKDEFLATVSHELRTPLNAILGWTHLLKSGKLSPETMADGLKAIEHSARAQTRLIEDILDVSRIITGKLQLTLQPVELVSVVRAALDTVRVAAEAKAIRLELVADPKAGFIPGDPDRLQQVVWNLLSNAVKFTGQGGRVTVRLEALGKHVQIQVSDTGQGIPADFLPYVFDRFYQADSTTTRSYSGLGLGLAIVRHLVELHGGTVRAESPGVGQGATFMIRLPRASSHHEAAGSKPTRADAEVATPAEPPPPLRGVRVLIVVDEAETRQILTLALEQYGCDVAAVGSVAEALELLTQSRWDVLVSDIAMPGQDGYTLIGRVRARPPEQGGRMPAVALTAYARVEDCQRALDAGYDSYIPKPAEPIELARAMADLLGRTGAA